MSTLDSLKVSLYIKCGALKKYKTFIPIPPSRLSKYVYLFLCYKISLSLKYLQKKWIYTNVFQTNNSNQYVTEFVV